MGAIAGRGRVGSGYGYKGNPTAPRTASRGQLAHSSSGLKQFFYMRRRRLNTSTPNAAKLRLDGAGTVYVPATTTGAVY